MSGTSLDGLDMALCDMRDDGFSLLAAATVPNTDAWRRRLSSLEEASALEYAKANVELGHYFGLQINAFLDGKAVRPQLVASHGHTIFHQPCSLGLDGNTPYGLTTQIGDGDAIAAVTGLPVVSNFRTLDVALGGQGAPLVPIGDELLFPQYDACLNFGGIANISYRDGSKRVAFDISPCNMALNRLALRLGLAYDPEGSNARRGHSHSCLMARLNDLSYYAEPGPKSLGKEWFVSQFWPLVEAAALSPEDALATVTSHVALQIARVLERQRIKTLLVTGGGAFNSYLLELVGQYCPTVTITVPDVDIINYKEAIIFALLGYLRVNGRVNTLASVTGARRNSIGGTLSGLL